MTAIPAHLKTVLELCQAVGRVYVPPPVPSTEELRAALSHMVSSGQPTLDGFPCAPSVAVEILAICRRRGWICGTRLTAAARHHASGDPPPRAYRRRRKPPFQTLETANA